MPVVTAGSERWVSLPVHTQEDIDKYRLDVYRWWRKQSGRAYLWATNASPDATCVHCSVPLIRDELSLCLVGEGRPLLDSLVCFECVEAQYLTECGDDRASLLDPFRVAGEH